ncbi:Uncharacterized protein BCZB5J_02164 [Bacillus cereus]|uniref:hypothetical protein n=1 Tax=Bacillus wiedmannii TaxID=1890302 RepID=UPI000817C6F9|nr:hypothetical protein [Bacillus wiedmannii]WMS85384.1 hypothetical protein RE438_31460 [Bacillus wiedmannii]SCC24346.1 Uncharacterized protein BCZB5J_02164 [Bacillus cereus]
MKLILGDKTNAFLNMIYEHLLKSTKGQVIWLDGHNIVNELAFDDEINEDKTIVRWRYNGVDILPEDTTGVLNMLNYIDQSLFNEFIEEDREYVQEEFTSYFMFALNEFRNVLNPPWGGSLSGFCQSLPYQWTIVSRYKPEIQVPRAFFGPPKKVPDDLILGYNTIVSDNSYNGMYWKVGLTHTLAREDHYLWYQRPPGDPFVVTVLDEYMWVQPFGDNNQISRTPEAVSKLCHALMEHFHLRLAVILFFYDERTNLYTFGSISPNVDAMHLHSSSIPEFLERISTTLE